MVREKVALLFYILLFILFVFPFDTPGAQTFTHGRTTYETETMGWALYGEDGSIVSPFSVQLELLTWNKIETRMHEFNQSLRYDRRMHAQDIRGSIAYAKALTLTGILTKDEEEKLIVGLTQVGDEWKNGTVLSTWRCVMLHIVH